MTTQDSLIGKTLGKYEILSLIGKGGMGKVYSAKNTHTGRLVALKTLLIDFSERHNNKIENEMARRFRREAQAIAQISHKNVVAVYDFEVAKDELPAYIVMEFLQGEPLDQVLKRVGKFSVKEALPLMIQICNGVGAAHKRRIVHRDLKPANIMILSPEDNNELKEIKILDFGIAKIIDPELTKLTISNQPFGTVKYVSPERCREEPVDERADVYSLSLIFYEMLMGDLPFKANSLAGWVNNHLYTSPKQLLDSIPLEINKLIMKGLEKDPEKRPLSANELKVRLVEIEKQIQKEQDRFVREIKENLKDSIAQIKHYKKKIDSTNLRIEELSKLNGELQHQLNIYRNASTGIMDILIGKSITKVVMPQMGEIIKEGTVIKWLCKEGDKVDRDEPLFEISTDKVDAEIPCPDKGVLISILVREGETVPIGTVVALIKRL